MTEDDAKSGLIIRANRATASEWDHFSAMCGCSYRCLYHASRYLHAGNLRVWRVRRFELYLAQNEQPLKIAQCAIAFGLSKRIFADQLQLRPEYRHLWLAAMAQLLKIVGPGSYIYGSEWATGTPDDADFASIAGVSLQSVQKAYLEAVDFSHWHDWDTYWRAVSANVRRNYARHVKAESDDRAIQLTRFQMLRRLPQLIHIRNTGLAKKGIVQSGLVSTVKSAFKWLVLWNSASAIAFIKAARVQGFAACTIVGDNTFYLEGGTRQNALGHGWFVLVNAIRAAFERSAGRGLFVMGPVDEETLAKPEWEGLARSRRQCRVVFRPVSTVNFTYC